MQKNYSCKLKVVFMHICFPTTKINVKHCKHFVQATQAITGLDLQHVYCVCLFFREYISDFFKDKICHEFISAVLKIINITVM